MSELEREFSSARDVKLTDIDIVTRYGQSDSKAALKVFGRSSGLPEFPQWPLIEDFLTMMMAGGSRSVVGLDIDIDIEGKTKEKMRPKYGATINQPLSRTSHALPCRKRHISASGSRFAQGPPVF